MKHSSTDFIGELYPTFKRIYSSFSNSPKNLKSRENFLILYGQYGLIQKKINMSQRKIEDQYHILTLKTFKSILVSKNMTAC
jgi:dimeric dUTPase (all-alpha-NTP-PPase superfamily)